MFYLFSEMYFPIELQQLVLALSDQYFINSAILIDSFTIWINTIYRTTYVLQYILGQSLCKPLLDIFEVLLHIKIYTMYIIF